jgi:hypothetical protein
MYEKEIKSVKQTVGNHDVAFKSYHFISFGNGCAYFIQIIRGSKFLNLKYSQAMAF